MVLEHARLSVKPGQSDEFLAAFSEASLIIKSMKGCRDVRLLQCHEVVDDFLLLVEWESLEDHTFGFRESEQYQQWRTLLHHFYEPFPKVLHYEPVVHLN